MVCKLEVEAICHGFWLPGGERSVVLDQVSMQVEAGSTVVLLGRSGCGKTTLLRVIMGLVEPWAGAVRVDGVDVRGCGSDRAMVFQQAELLPWRSALANVALGLEALGVTKSERLLRARHQLELVGLGNAAERRPHQLSGGMRQRVGIARALAVDPAVLLMDEPFGALDAQTRESLQGALLDIQRRTGKTIVFVTHDVDEAVLLADHVVVMSANPGRVGSVVNVRLPARQAGVDVALVKESAEYVETRGRVRVAMGLAGDGAAAVDALAAVAGGRR